ncbi:LacI family DNA-binding transcriptional regulator [Chengkuizengella sediminis]|uniref:LacI family DNA-binding transcriptional regulator n=1 Tax=Chengkuizengella sediminis TaxID=1885917 RepID=UPI001389FB1D|nr:LacI family DNA-binding transcriptional regulator [Chengkuizengella sediminis]NDI36481.1 LacI family transcriptional regulator [Chengkuizengella sediminis]
MTNKIKDVSAKAGVSPTTVSRVLNNSKLVNEKTKRKVLKVIEEMGYIPNASAKNLRSKKTMTIGVIVTDILVSYNADIIKGIENMANSLNYKIIICDAQDQKEKEIDYLNLLYNRTIDGMILVTSTLSDQEISKIAEQGYNIGVIGRNIEHDLVSCVYNDNIKAVQEVIDHLVQNGHKEIVFISGLKDAVDSHERLEGYMNALKRNELPFDPELVDNGDFSENGGYEAIKRIIQRDKKFTAVFAANDEMALGVYNAFKELNIKIPEQVAVVGVDNIRVCSYVSPKLSTVAQPKYSMGALMTEKLIDQMNENKYTSSRTFKVSSTLLVRESSEYKI